MYAGLVDDDEVNEQELTTYFREFQLQPDQVKREYSPGPGTTIYRDTWGEIRSGTASKPVEYFVQRVELEDWDPTDTVALIVLQLRGFGGGGGREVANAAALQGLRKKHGKAIGTRIFDDLRRLNDANAYPTVPPEEGTFQTQQLGAVDPRAVAIPKQARALAATPASSKVSESERCAA
jgi:hypothetical protein